MRWSTIEHDVDTHVTASSIEDPFLPLSLLFSFLFFFSSFFFVFFVGSNKSALRVLLQIVAFTAESRRSQKDWTVFRGAMCRLQKQRKKPAEEDCVFRREKGKRKDCVSTKKIYLHVPPCGALYWISHFFCQRLRPKVLFQLCIIIIYLELIMSLRLFNLKNLKRETKM